MYNILSIGKASLFVMLCYVIVWITLFLFFSFLAPGVGGIQLHLISIAQAIKHLIQK
jgi:hypothetical protein